MKNTESNQVRMFDLAKFKTGEREAKIQAGKESRLKEEHSLKARAYILLLLVCLTPGNKYQYAYTKMLYSKLARQIRRQNKT